MTTPSLQIQDDLLQQGYILGSQQQIRDRWDLNVDYPTPNAAEMVFLRELELSPNYVKVIKSSDVFVQIDKNMPAWIVYLLICNAYEHGDVRLIREHVCAGQRAIVIGGGIGLIAAAIALVSHTSPTVIEANPFLLHRLSNTAALNGVDFNVLYGAVKAGSSSGMARFHISKEFWASSLREDTWQPMTVMDVPIINLEQHLLEGYEIAFFDIEGEEAIIFEEIELPSTLETIFVEVHRPVIGAKASAALMNKLWRQGFSLIDAEGLTFCWKRN